MNNSVSSTNTTVAFVSSQWSFAFTTQSLLAVSGFLLNSYVLIILLRGKFEHSSFIIYLRVLIAGNVLYISARFPLYFVREFSRSWWMGVAACSLQVYAILVFAAFLKHVEALITINRIWALTFPISYKNKHAKKMAGLLCGAICVYVHVVGMTGFVQDLLFYRRPISQGCAFSSSAQATFYTVMQLLIYDLPVVFVVSAYPYLLYKRLQRRKKILDSRTSGNTSHDAVNTVRSVEKPRSRPFLLLTLLTASLFLCWTPVLTYWTISLFTSVDGLAVLYKIGVFLSSLQLVLDPILFALSFDLFPCRMV